MVVGGCALGLAVSAVLRNLNLPPNVFGVRPRTTGSEVATAHLNAMNALGSHPWQLSFSYGRALQDTAIKTWSGKARPSM